MKRRRQTPSTNTPPEQSLETGLPSAGEPVYLAVGRLRRSHGVQGEMVMDVLTDFPERLWAGKTVYVGDQHTPIRILSVRGHDRDMIVHMEGLDSPETAVPYRNALLFVKAAEIPALPEGQYYHHQLLGLRVVDETGTALGVLEQILETGANDVYLVRTGDGKELLLPAVDEVILAVDLAQREMRVRPPEWL